MDVVDLLEDSGLIERFQNLEGQVADLRASLKIMKANYHGLNERLRQMESDLETMTSYRRAWAEELEFVNQKLKDLGVPSRA